MFWLAGALDALVAQVMYPQELLRDSKTPQYDMAASTWDGLPLCDCAKDNDAYFLPGCCTGGANSRFSGGLFVMA